MKILTSLWDRLAVARAVLNDLQGAPAKRQSNGRFIVVDPALIGNVGHHANACRYLIRAAQSLGIPARLLAHKEVEPVVQSDLGAVPYFRAYTYTTTDPLDPISGWLKIFLGTTEVTRADLESLSDINREDIVLIHGAQPAQLRAAIEWALRLPDERFPLVIVELGGDPGVGMVSTKSGRNGFAVPNPLTDARAMLFRFAVQWLDRLKGKPFHIITYDPTISNIYTRLMDQPVGVLPFPTPAITDLRRRSGKGPITIATLGHQQGMKGYHLMPDVVEKVLKQENNVRFLIHNSDPQQKFCGNAIELTRSAQEKLRAMASADSRIVLDEREVEFDQWTRLIETVDLMLCPYDPVRYATGHSGLASAAVANGIPLVVPAKTSLSKWVEDFGDCGVTFDKHDAPSVAAAVRRALKSFDEYAARAFLAASKWADTQGPVNCVNELLRLKEQRFNGMQTPGPLGDSQDRHAEIEVDAG